MVAQIRRVIHRHPRAVIGAGVVASIVLVCAAAALVITNPWQDQGIGGPETTYENDDFEGPTVERVAPVSPSSFDVVFSEKVATETVVAANFATKPQLPLRSVVLQRDGRTVRVTIGKKQKPGEAYMVACPPQTVADLAGNRNALTVGARFPGFGANGGRLSVKQGAGTSRPDGQVVKRPNDVVVVDQLELQATGGDVTISTVNVRAQTNYQDIFADLVEAWLFEDNGDGVFQANGTDRQLSEPRPFRGRLANSPAVFDGLGYTVESGQTRNVWVVFRLGNLARTGNAIGSLIRPSDIVASAGTITPFDEVVSANDGVTVRVDAVGPIMVTGAIVDPTTVEVRFDSPLEPTSVNAGDFKVNGLRAQSVALQPGGTTVRIRTTAPVDSSVDVTYGEGGTVEGLDGQGAEWSMTTELSAAQSTPASDTTPPSVPGSVNAVVGVNPVIGRVTWAAATDNIAVTGYRVYRAQTGAAYRAIGTTVGVSFDDTSGISGLSYRYKVTAYDALSNESTLSAQSPTVTAAWTPLPHRSYGQGNACNLCHLPHDAKTDSGILRDTPSGTGEVPLCYECHDGTGASFNVKNGATNSFATSMTSGHSLEAKVDTSNVDLTNACSGCHGAHQQYATKDSLYASQVNGKTVTGNNKSWCLACHDDKHSWWKPGEAAYESLINTPTRDTTAYPTAGTFPGGDVASSALNAHNSVLETPGAEPGACRMCHNIGHRSTAPYDMLRRRLSPSKAASVTADRQTGDYAAECLECHKAGNTLGATDIKSLVTYAPTDADNNAGHRIRSATASLPVGAPLPCYECHNPHGSGKGNLKNLSDDLGQNLSTSSPANVRAFCLSCHTTHDNQVWNSTTSAYRAVVATEKYLGLFRNGSDGSLLKLVAIDGHAAGDTTKSCYQCHGIEWTAGRGNPHAPGPGESSGNLTCLQCHDQTTYMQSATTYHHVMSNDTTSYATIADASTITAADARRNCLICHVDHDYFNKSLNASNPTGRSRNLRSDISTAPAKANTNTYVNYDFSDLDPGDGGVCVSCHKIRLTKNTTARNASTDRGPMTQPVRRTDYAATAHNYFALAPNRSTQSTSTTFTTDVSGFKANCGKCHNDKMTRLFQGSPFSFGLHDSPIESMLWDNGDVLVGTSPEEKQCYLCHSRTIDLSPNNPRGGATYSSTGTDLYGGAYAGSVMTSDSLNVKGMFSNAAIVSSHPVTGNGTSTSRVECENCHNPHKTEQDAASGASGVVQDPDNTLVGSSAGGDQVYYNGPSTGAQYDQNTKFCLKCHDGAAPVYTNNGTAYVPYGVFIESAATTVTNKARYRGRGHSNSISSETSTGATTIQLECATCHDKHGSRLPKLLGVNGSAAASPTINGTIINANDNTLCATCHTLATPNYPSASVNASGYPMLGTFPGIAGWSNYNTTTHVGNPHRTVQWPRNGGTGYANGDCKQCHDVHGTANTYDQLRTETSSSVEGQYLYSPSKASFCFNCHDASGPATTDIGSYYPAASGGTGSQANAGHRTSTSGHLPANSAMPCYLCHNAHGSPSAYSLLVVTQSQAATLAIGDVSGEITMTPTRTAIDVRKFCLTCHVTGDVTGMGWNGATYQAVGGTARVAGILRDSAGAKLKLVKLFGDTAHEQASTKSCYQCHGNIHAPTTPSPATRDCYSSGCHDNLNSMDTTSATNTNSYHHVLGSATQKGDMPIGTGSYPTSKQDVFCTSCHVDHDYFDPTLGGATRGLNLRRSVNTTSGATRSNVDFMPAEADKGICVSCHSVRLTKDVARQKQDNTAWETVSTTFTPVIDGTKFDNSAHQYSVVATIPEDNTNIYGDCAKCHNDNQTSQYGFTKSFQVHSSAERNLLAALGATLTDPVAGRHCLGCHSEQGDIVSGKPTVDRDYYGNDGSAMAQPAELVYKAFSRAGGSAHPVNGGTGQVLCENCHNPHIVSQTATQTDPTNNYNVYTYSTEVQKQDYCLKCHTTAGLLPKYQLDATTYVPGTVKMAQPKMDKKGNEARSHWMPNASIQSSTTAGCQDCHDKHGSKYEKIVGVYTPGTDTARVNGQVITGNNNSVCSVTGCHSAAGLGYPSGAPTLASIDTHEARRDSTGYFSPTPSSTVTTVRWPGMTVWGSVAVAGGKSVSPHFNNAYTYNGRAANDCKQCHDVHGSAYTYDETPKRYDANNFTLCFDCHNGTGIPGLKNIWAYYPASVGGKGNPSDYAGHIIKTDDPLAKLRPGDPLPCYDCHMEHGSSNGNTYMLSDQRWSGLVDPKVTQARNMCLGCHITADGYDGEGRLLAASDTSNLIEGFPRWPSTRPTNALKIPPLPAPNMEHHNAGTAPCTDCHGRDYTTDNSINVHNPSPGISGGGTSCYNCHYAYTGMEDQTGSKVGDPNQYHHVLGGTFGVYREGDYAPKDAPYPTSTTEMFCVSCHVDHNYFNGPTYNSGTNLRQSITSTATANTDFLTLSPYGICVSCHGVATPLAKQSGQKSDGMVPTVTPVIAGPAYDGSAHQYGVSSYFDSPANLFNADCAKCHDDGIDAVQDSPYAFGVHIGPEQRLLTALGATQEEALQEKHCYRCHARQGELASGKSMADKDWYGVGNMTAASQRVYGAFQLPGSSHPVTGTGTASSSRVECANCHNPHSVNSASPMSVPSNTYNLANSGATDWSTVDGKTAVCLDCHDNTLPARTITGAAYVPYSVAQLGTDAPLMNKSGANASKAHWSTTGAISAGERQTCVACHDKHGSNAPKLLGVYNGSASMLGTQTITANDNTVCRGCHPEAAPASFASPSRNASGYPNEGTWPGFAVWNQSYSAATHTGTGHRNAVWTGKAGTYAPGDCKNCHDVHGTPNTYDMVRTENTATVDTYRFAPNSFTVCFNCHDGSPASSNIAQFYPANVGGTGANTGRTGHQLTHASATLPQGAALPCYECHNPHGSQAAYSLTVDTGLTGASKILGDAPGEITLDAARGADGVRKFCFACHVSTDGYGWDGQNYTTVPSTAYNSGFQRIAAGNDLSLSGVTEHYWSSGTQTANCYDCHAEAGFATYNVHNPKTGGADHNSNILGDPDGAGPKPTYTYSDNYGCFGCHYPDLVDEHGTLGNRTYELGGTGCGICHAGYANGVPNIDQYAAVQAAITNDDLRCSTCHNNGTNTDNATNKTIASAHKKLVANVGVAPPKAEAAGFVWADPAAEFINWPAGGGHNSFGTTATFPKTAFVYGGTTYNWPWPTTWVPLTNPSFTRTSMVACSDCHGDYVANGPQGANVPISMETGYSATDYANPTGTDKNTNNWARYTVVGQRVICAKCHAGADGWGGVHSNHTGQTPGSGGACIDCHLRIPHAWRRPRLLRRTVGGTGTLGGATYPADTLPYADPARSGLIGVRLRDMSGGVSWSANADCSTSCGRHAATQANTWYWP